MIPVILFVYNRPEHTEKTLAALKKNNIDLLYVFSDADNAGNAVSNVENVRHIIDKIDWVETRVFKHNAHKGVAGSVIDGVSVVLGIYDMAIILEDDCISSPCFYSYMCQCLKQYENDGRISVVSASVPPIKNHILKNYTYDVFFWERFFSTGWGTWRNIWKDFNPHFGTLLKEIKKRNIDTSLFGQDVKFNVLVEQMFNADSWATPFFLNMVLNNSMSVMPVKNYIKNVGFDGTGTHNIISTKYGFPIEQHEAPRSLIFPQSVVENKKIARGLVCFLNEDKCFFEKLNEFCIFPLMYLFSKPDEIFSKAKRYIYKKYHNIISIGSIYYVVGKLNDSSIAVDVGTGPEADFSRELVKLFGLKSFGFDPTRKHHGFLERISGRAWPFFKFYKFALSDSKGDRRFYETADNVSGSFYRDHVNIKNDKISEYDAKTITLSDIFNLLNVSKIDVLKLDIEGAEYAVLESAGVDILEKISQLVVEFHHEIVGRFTALDTQRVIKYLKGLGYKVYTKDFRNYLFFKNK